MGKKSLLDWFLKNVETGPNNPAFWADGRVWTYCELQQEIGAIREILAEIPGLDPVGVIADRSAASYLAILACVAGGRPFVPLQPRYPPERAHAIWRQAGGSVMMCGIAGCPAARAILALRDDPVEIVWLDRTADPPPELSSGKRQVHVIGLPCDGLIVARDIHVEERLAYILFTSGSTGVPKGVAVNHASVMSYVDVILRTYNPGPADRFSQVFDQTFDLCMHDLFVSLSSGGCLHVVPTREQHVPGRFAREHGLTFWLSTPSTAAMMARVGGVEPDSYPDLRVSLFCGEALPVDLARRWLRAAPNSQVENLYGPTEATIAITRHPISSTCLDDSAAIVPIGRPFEGQEAAILDACGHAAWPMGGEEGELIVSGSQLAVGYWKDEIQTKHAFPSSLPGDPLGRRWYRTGDLVRYDASVGYSFLGRLDDQVKIRGHRVSLTEVDLAMRGVSGATLVASFAWPSGTSGLDGIIVFLCGSQLDEKMVRERCASVLPPYMIPRRILFLEEMPINASGKIDRSALRELLRVKVI